MVGEDKEEVRKEKRKKSVGGGEVDENEKKDRISLVSHLELTLSASMNSCSLSPSVRLEGGFLPCSIWLFVVVVVVVWIRWREREGRGGGA